MRLADRALRIAGNARKQDRAKRIFMSWHSGCRTVEAHARWAARLARRFRDNMRACSCKGCKRYGGRAVRADIEELSWRRHDEYDFLEAIAEPDARRAD